jgi:cyclopropane-fatty-acyl-phospholipid synthase
MMPAQDLLKNASSLSTLVNSWAWPGTHYQRTAEAWLERHDANRAAIMEIFAKHYGPTKAKVWFQRWRIFYLSVAELFGYHQGREWYVMHCLLRKTEAAVVSDKLGT